MSKPLSDQIRAAVDNSEMSRYRICKTIGLSESSMSKFMAGKGVSLDVLDKLAAVLKLNITTATRKAR
jgi:hypothetical protein